LPASRFDPELRQKLIDALSPHFAKISELEYGKALSKSITRPKAFNPLFAFFWKKNLFLSKKSLSLQGQINFL